jgi:hypothetical protein
VRLVARFHVPKQSYFVLASPHLLRIRHVDTEFGIEIVTAWMLELWTDFP